MCRFTRKGIFFYFLIYSVNFTQIVAVSKELFEYSQPSKCKNNEYFDTISLTCMPCDANKNLKPSVDREFEIKFFNILFKYLNHSFYRITMYM